MFTDRAILELTAGKGGDGLVAWRREKFIPKGGPSGGNGGRGGDVILQADKQVYCLEWYRHRKILKAENGQQGGTNLCQGRGGKHLVLKVPCGTLVKDAKTGEVLYDLTKDGDKVVICTGGKGGLGNEHFKSPTNQAPIQFTYGKLGDEKRIELELKLIADIGLVGFPNAGKSTIISAMANVRVKIAPYPFTTLHPNIGVIQSAGQERLFMADIPGIIEGAHANRGLGHEFLRHIERTSLLIFVLDASGIDGRTPTDDYRVLRDELKRYSDVVSDRPYLIAMNKMDDVDAAANAKIFYETYPEEKGKVYELIAMLGDGIPALKEAIFANCHKKDVDITE